MQIIRPFGIQGFYLCKTWSQPHPRGPGNTVDAGLPLARLDEAQMSQLGQAAVEQGQGFSLFVALAAGGDNVAVCGTFCGSKWGVAFVFFIFILCFLFVVNAMVRGGWRGRPSESIPQIAYVDDVAGFVEKGQ